jgi:hypothetical protein
LLGTSTAHTQGEKRKSADNTESGQYLFHGFPFLLAVCHTDNCTAIGRSMDSRYRICSGGGVLLEPLAQTLDFVASQGLGCAVKREF